MQGGRHRRLAGLIVGFGLIHGSLCIAQTSADSDAGPAAWLPRLLGAQVTVIDQHLRPFHAPYSGPQSLRSDGDTESSQTYGVYLGSRLTDHLQAYLDVEMARGAGISKATGLGGITNGDIIRQGTADLGKGPYLARGFLRYLIPLGAAGATEEKTRAMDQLPGREPAVRIEIKAGRFALSDDFDVNRYADSTRTQFLNWGLFNNTAWDFAANTRGYTNGLFVGWVHPGWTLRAGSFQMPTQANGNVFDDDIRRARGDNLELTLNPGSAIVRLLAWRNEARMGRYEDAVALARLQSTRPDIEADDRPGRTKYGFGLNAEKPLADDGETGVFARLGWSDGRNESFAFTEVDRHASACVQIAGRSWGRADDRLGIALLWHGLSEAHRNYLAAGGAGFLLGDGHLRYGPEEISEVYYRAALPWGFHIGPDLQLIRHPGDNRDRGPATVLGLRVDARY